jgi:hypothetical protein
MADSILEYLVLDYIRIEEGSVYLFSPYFIPILDKWLSIGWSSGSRNHREPENDASCPDLSAAVWPWSYYSICMKNRLRSIVCLAVVNMCLVFLLASCAGFVLKAYSGPDLPATQTAFVEGGPFTYLEKVDGAVLSSSQVAALVLPGPRTLEVAYAGEHVGDRFLYSGEKATLSFDAVAGHRYVVYASQTSGYWWSAYVQDKDTSERLASSRTMPLRAYYMPPHQR